jgi:hypothetical protein
MQALETQVAKIQLGGSPQVTSYVFVQAEKVDSSDTELYVVCELPLFNPAAYDDCEHIATVIAAELKRAYRIRQTGDQQFEQALARINEELGKLSDLGKAQWQSKLNALVAVKQDTTLFVAAVGKVSALLYREGKFVSIAEPGKIKQPLKTFDSFSSGRLALGDILLFSTTQLLNHISIDRIKSFLEASPLPEAAQSIVNVLQDTIGPEVACGSILALQAEPQTVTVNSPETAPVTVADALIAEAANTAPKPALTGRSRDLVNKALAQVASFGQKAAPAMKQLTGLWTNRKQTLGVVEDRFARAKSFIQPATIKGFSTRKKIFLVSAIVLAMALTANIIITRSYQKSQSAVAATTAQINEVKQLLDDSNSLALYGDKEQAADKYRQAVSKLSGLVADKTNQTAFTELQQKVADVQNRLEKRKTVNAGILGTLSTTNTLLVLPNYLATEINRTIVSYNRTSKAIQDNLLRSSEPINAAVATKQNQAVIYNGKELLLWNTQTGLVSGASSDRVPVGMPSGMAYYPTNNRVYLVDTSAKQVLSFIAGPTNFTKPVVSVNTTADLADATDIAIDGSIYIATKNNILKFNSGARQTFTIVTAQPLSGNVKVRTQTDFKNVYILDPGNKRIIVTNKQGDIVQTIASPQLTNPVDFTVDEKAQTAYVLNDGMLLELKFGQ